jgi:hypothetical protein
LFLLIVYFYLYNTNRWVFYWWFLVNNQAEAYYKKSLELEPDNAIVNNNYALFLTKQAKKYQEKLKELGKKQDIEDILFCLLGSVSFLTCNS